MKQILQNSNTIFLYSLFCLSTSCFLFYSCDSSEVDLQNLSKPILSATLADLQNSVTLTWTDNSPLAKGYHVQRKLGNEEFVTIANLEKGSMMTYSDTDMDTTKNYTYQIEVYSDQNQLNSDSLSIRYRTQGYSLYDSYNVPESPDGKIAISPNGEKIVITNYFDDNFTVINLLDGSKKQLAHPGGTFGLCMSQSGGFFAIEGSHDTKIDLWDLNTLSLKSQIDPMITAFEITFDNSSDKIVVGGEPVKVYSTASGSLVKDFKTGNNLTRAIKYSKNETLLLTGTNENLLKLWNTSTGEAVKTFTGHLGHVGSACFIKNETEIISGSYEDNTLRIWDAASSNLLKTLPQESAVVGILNLANNKLVVAKANGTIFFMDEDAEIIQEFGEPLKLYSIDYDTTSELLVVYTDQIVKIYKPDKGWEIL